MMDYLFGSGAEPLRNEFKDNEVIDCEIKKFPDGDKYVKILDEVGDEVTIVQSTYSPQDEKLMEVMLFGDALMEKGADKINAVIPYMAYSRQDRVVEEGEPVSIRAVAKMLNQYIDDFYFFDLHNPKTTRFFMSAKNLIPVKPFARYFKNLDSPVVLAPDKGALERAKKLAQEIDAEFDYIEKNRISSTEVEMNASDIDVSGKDLIIFDDIISTGGTMSEAIKSLNNQNTNSIYAACTHAFLMEDASIRIKKAGADKIVAANTIPHQEETVSIYPEIKENLE